MDERSHHRQFEDRFVSQLRGRALALLPGGLPSDEVAITPTSEGIDALRAELGRLEVYDRDALASLPGTRSIQMHFQRKILGGLARTTVARLRVRVLAPVEPLLNNQTPGPVGRQQVLDALAVYDSLPRRDKPSGVILASATGFTDDAKSLVESHGPPTLILAGGREDGGWDMSMAPAVQKSPWARLLELESQDQRLRRLFYHLDQNAELVDSRGISVAALADALGLSRAETEALVRRACRSEPQLLTVMHDGKTHVCRTPLAEEGNTMSIWSRIRKLLRLKPTTAERVRELTGQRVQIEQQRFELDQKVNALEAEERRLIQQGAAAASDAERKQAAGKLMRTRRELRRQRAQAQLYTQQIDIIGTHMHHLTLAERGKRLVLPTAEDLTREAAQAEQVAAEVAADADLAASIEVTGQTPLMAEEEAAILEEFKQAAASRAAAPAEEAEKPAAEAASAPRETPQQAAEPMPQKHKDRAAPPEAG